MALVKPTLGQNNWGDELNTALDYLDTNALKVSTRNPVVSNTTPIELVLSDAGTVIVVTHDDNNYSQDFRIPANAAVAFPVGTIITFITLDSSIWFQEQYHEASDTSPTLYGEGQGTNTNWMGFNGTSIGRLIKITTNEWILTGNNIYWD